MKDVYQLAYRVLAWLGPNQGEEDHAVGCIFQQANKAGLMAESLKPDRDDDMTVDFDEMANYPVADELGSSLDAFNATLCDLLARPWFGRVWIVQEMSLPRQSPLVFAGSYVTSLENLLRIFLAVDKYHTARSDPTGNKKIKKPSGGHPRLQPDPASVLELYC